MELSVPSARGTGEAAKGRGRTEARTRDRMESANAIVWALPLAPAQRQATDGRCYGGCPRAIGLPLGDQPRGPTKSRKGTPPPPGAARVGRRAPRPQPRPCTPEPNKNR